MAVSPTWKVPTARFPDGRVLWESGIIHDAMVTAAGGAFPAADEATRLRIATIDAGLDAAIARFYAKRDGVDLGVPYLEKHRARIDLSMGWVVAQAEAGAFSTLTLDTIALVTTLEWFTLRSAWHVQHPALTQVLARWSEHGSFKATRP